MEFDEIQQFREALKASPQNIPIRRLLINALLKAERLEEAEIELKDVLKMSGGKIQFKIDLAEVYLKMNKTGVGLVIMEELTEGNPPPRAWIVYAKLLLKAKNLPEAKEAYEIGTGLDPDLIDPFLEAEINLEFQKNEPQEPQKIKLGGPDFGDDDDFFDEEEFIEIERPKVTFEDVGGMDKVKKEIEMKIIHPLKHPEIYKQYGKKIGGGILLYGPPGCGKTYLARATAGQVNSNFIPVGINEILGMYIGQSEGNLHAIFQKARQLKPTVLFFDEVDALGASRSDMRQSAGRHIINQFLNEMDGIEYSNDGMLILAATNTPWHLDAAFRRPGRFDRIIFVPPPDAESRVAILKIKLKDKPIGNINYEKIARNTEEFSGADLEAVIDKAIESKLEESIRTGVPVPLETNDFLKAAKTHPPSTKEWFSTAKNYALFANEAGLYNDILDYLKIKR